jgi:uncharacterized protein YciI
MKFLKSLLLLLLLAGPFSLAAQPKTYTIVFLNKRADAEKLSDEAGQKLMDGHMANMKRLAKEGKLLAAGPFDGGGGIFIFNTTSQDEAETWLSTDPGVQASRWTLEILPYTPRTGSVCPVAEPFEMVSYTFIRFTAIIQKYTASNYPMIIRQHEAFLKKVVDPSDIVTEATFGPNEGGILIVKSELPSDAFSIDPGVQQGLLDVQMKKLYIARSSFCEN